MAFKGKKVHFWSWCPTSYYELLKKFVGNFSKVRTRIFEATGALDLFLWRHFAVLSAHRPLSIQRHTPSVQLYHAGYIPIPFQHRRPWHLVECNCCSSRSFTANCFGEVVDVRVGSFLAAVSCINGHPTPAKAIGHDGRCNCCNIAMAAKAAESLQLLQRCDDPGCCCVVTLPANC